MGTLTAPEVETPRRAPAPPAPASEARPAFTVSAAVGLGLVPLGLAFGMIIARAGLPWWCATVFTSLIYAGSFEFLLVGLVTAVAPLATIAVTAFLVNVRHVFYALSFPLDRVPGRAARTYSTFSMTDEAYALSTAEQARDWPGRRIVWLQAFLHLYWVGGATAGVLLGGLIPARVQGFDFALVALFTVLALEAVRAQRTDLSTPALAVFSALAARLLFPDQMLLAAFALFTAALLARRHAVEQRSANA